MSVLSIREAQESDIDRLIEMRLALQKHHEERNPRVWRMSHAGRAGLRDGMLDLLSDRSVRVFVAVDDDGDLAGMVIASAIEGERHLPSMSGKMDWLFVSEAYRRRGIGIQLVKRVCQFFAEHHIEEVAVGYIAENTEAIQFWDKLGFEPRVITAGTKLRDLEAKLAERGVNNG